MRQAPRLTVAVACGMAIVSSACESSTTPDPQFAVIEVDVRECADNGQTFTLASQNAYFPIAPVGREWVLTGEDKGDLIELTVTVLDSTEDVGSATTRIVREVEVVNDDTVEVSYNYFAENADGMVCYFGEDVFIRPPEGGISKEGSWRADDTSDPNNLFFPGIIMPAEPRVGMRFQMEGAPGIAEDEGRITGSGQVKVTAGTYTATLRVREFNPLDGGTGFKIFAEGVGLLVDAAVQLQSCTQGCPAGS